MNPNPPIPTPPRRPRRTAGISTIELLLSMALVASGLGALVVTANSLRSDSAEKQTRATLASLASALNAYHNARHAWPPDPTEKALTALAQDPASSPFFSPLPIARDTAGRPVLRDGHGNAIRYIPPSSLNPSADFVSPGPDGRFGERAGQDASSRPHPDDLFASDMEAATR